MTRIHTGLTMAIALAMSTLVAGDAQAQHSAPGHHPAATHDHSHQAAAQGGRAGHDFAQACAQEFDSVVRDGRGFGMAFVADQNGYPGPLHVLELKERLALTPEQQHRMQTLMDGMFAEARPAGARLLEAEARLRALFAETRADETAVRAAVAEVEKRRAEVRLVHLLTHLRTRDLLTAEQRSAYKAARWPAR
jgi:Spy/CpxP family protein refolding chaperone